MRLQLSSALAALAVLSGTRAARADDPAWKVSSDSVLYTDTDNVTVVSPQVAVRRNLDDDGGSVGARAVVDVVSAASVDVVSSATTRFSEVRTELEIDVSKAVGGVLPSLAYHQSHEPDYDSRGVSAGLQRDFAHSDTTVRIGYDLTLDTIGFTGTPTSAFSESLTSHHGSVSVTQVIDPSTIVRGVYTLSVQNGYMEKPYRFVPLFDNDRLQNAFNDGVAIDLDTFDRYRLDMRPPEEVPDRRVGQAFAVRGLRYLDSLPGALRLDYQLFLDSWGVVANTIEPQVAWKIAGPLVLAGYARFYLQQGASFWRRLYIVDEPDQIPRWRTLDRDLSDMSALSIGARGEWNGARLSGYADVCAMETFYSDYLFLDSRLALIAQVGVRLAL